MISKLNTSKQNRNVDLAAHVGPGFCRVNQAFIRENGWEDAPI